MALKFGRTSGITSRIDPKTNTIKYTEEELDAYNTAVGAEVKRKSDYDASMAKFKTDSDVYYGRNVVDTKGAEATASFLNKNNLKTSKGENLVATAAREETQAQIDKRYDDAIKSGKMVPYNDPSIDDETRRFLKGATYGADLSRSAFDKGLKIRNYNEVYEGDYNPEIWLADAKKGKDSRYGTGSHFPDKVGMYTRGVTPVKPAAYVPANLGKEIKAKDVDWKQSKMEPLKPTKVDKKKYGKLRPAKEEEAPTWQAPGLDKRKKATHIKATKIYASETTKSGRHKDSRLGIHNAARIKQSDASSPQRIKYNTEKRQSAAYYGNETVTGEKITGKTASQLESLKQEVKGDVKRMKGEGRTQDARDVRGDLPQIRKAIRYAKRGDLGVGSVTGLTMEGDKSTLRYFTPERTKLAMNGGDKKTREDGAMAGYKDVQRYNNNKAMEQSFKGQADNPANRNTVVNQQEKLAFKNQQAKLATAANTVTPSYGSQVREKIKTDNPTATKREVRALVQTKKDADQALMNKVNLDMQAKDLIPKK
jgi:hypothetical protein